jgi:hypothetical protein
VRRAARLFQLQRRERAPLLQALLLILVARVSLALFGFTRTQRLFRRMSRVAPGVHSEHDVQEIALVTQRMVRAAAVHGICGATCLPRSLVAWALLRRLGLDPELKLGARRRAGVFEAHAWVTIGSLALDDGTGDDGEPFAPFAIGTPLDEHHNAIR